MGGEWDESKHPRVPAGSGDPSGQFTSGGVEGGAATLQEMFDRIRKPGGGFTYQPRLRFEPKNGYAVSIYPKRALVRRRTEFTATDIGRFMVHNIDLLAKKEHYIGGWNDPRSHQLFLDVSIVVPDAARARELSVRHGQKAYFNLATHETTYVNPHAKGAGDD